MFLNKQLILTNNNNNRNNIIQGPTSPRSSRSSSNIKYNISNKDVKYNITNKDIKYNISNKDVKYNISNKDITHNKKYKKENKEKKNINLNKCKKCEKCNLPIKPTKNIIKIDNEINDKYLHMKEIISKQSYKLSARLLPYTTNQNSWKGISDEYFENPFEADLKYKLSKEEISVDGKHRKGNLDWNLTELKKYIEKEDIII